jgi:outer membrane receptor protein involved in Fe transport
VLCFLILTLLASVFPQGSQTLRGTVLDSTGSAIAGAKIEFKFRGGSRLTTSDVEGNFAISDISGGGTLLVRYPGFAPVTLEVDASRIGESLYIALNPAPSVERIQVSSGAENRIPPVPTSQYSIPRQEIEVSGSLSVDEILRQTPGFTLFRRSGSLFANPTSQGVSLRGVGANGTSRAVVLVDGIPLNDPFGGWVYWNRVPRVSIESVDVFNGGSSDLYGGGALGGVINIQTRSVRKSFASIETSYGNEDTKFISLAAGVLVGKWALAASGQALRTAGYVIIPENLRGAIDTPAGTGDLMGSVQVSRNIEQGQFFVRVSTLGESRKNGTPAQTNDTSIPEIDLGVDWVHPSAGSFSLRAYGTKEVFHQGFSAIAAGRNREILTDLQRSPSGQVGFAGQWRRNFARKHAVTAGIEAHGVHGNSFERFFDAAGPTMISDSGGRQTAFGFFGQDTLRFAQHWMLTAGGRVDTWNNTSGYAYTIPVTTGTRSRTFPNRRETVLSPRVSLLRTFGGTVSVNASVYRAFRAPTLNELYRGFRVGNTLTNANPALFAERLTGGEAGICLTPWSERVTLRGNFFWSDISNPVTNVTLSTSTLITRQRQNLGVTRARGAEFSGEAKLPRHMRLTAAYILTEGTVVSAPGLAALVGLRVQQVPKNQFNIQWTYADRDWTAGMQGRFVGLQFDDDRNTFPLESFFTLDAEVSRRLLPHAKIFFGAQNLTGSRYAVARTPILTVGPPVLVRGGFRFDFP